MQMAKMLRVDLATRVGLTVHIYQTTSSYTRGKDKLGTIYMVLQGLCETSFPGPRVDGIRPTPNEQKKYDS